MKIVLTLCFIRAVLGQTFDTSLEVPGLGRSVSLGALYDARTDKIVRGFNPWKQESLEKNILEKDGSQSDHCMIASNSFDKKADALDVGLKVKASFLMGKIEVGGAANYLKEKSQSNYEAEVGFRFRQYTHTREMTMSQLNLVDYPNVFDLATDATHFVAKIQYGVNAVFKFSEMSKSIEEKSSIQTKLSVAVKFVYGDVDTSAHLNINATERKEFSSFSCKYMGDVALKPPTTFLEAVETYKTLPSLVNKDVSQPLTIELLPISKLDSKLNRIVRQIETNLLKDVVERMNDYDNRQEEIGDLRLSQVYPALSLFGKQIENFHLALNSHRDNFQFDLSDVLPKVRETAIDEDKLENVLDERQHYVTMDRLERWSYWKQREAGALTPLATWNPKLIVTDQGLEKIKFNNSVHNIVALALHLYPEKDPFTECAKYNCGPNGNGNKKCPNLNCANNNQYKSWIENSPLKSALRSTFGRYQRIVNLANEIKPTGDGTVYLIREVPVDKDGEKITIELYHKDQLIQTDFQLPKINIGAVEGNATRRLLKWNVTGSEATMNLVNKNQFIVQYRPVTRLNWKKLVPKQKSVWIPCAEDFEVAVYVMCTFGVCGVQNTTIRAEPPPVIPLKILLIGGEDANARSSMEYYYPFWPRYDSPLYDVKMLQPRAGHTSVVNNKGNVMTIGGYSYKYNWIVKNVEIFNPNTNNVTQGKDMRNARQYCAGVALDDVVYVCGGYNNNNGFLASCERYRYKQWDTVANMRENRQEFAMVPLNGYIYAIGGYNGYKLKLATVEQYSPDSNTWETMPSMKMNTARQGHGAAVFQQTIYVCGGSDDRSCEKYDFTKNQWIYMAQTISARGKGVAMLSDEHHLFAFGGSADAQITAEMYNTKTSNWTQLKPLAFKRSYSSAVIVE